MAYTQVSQTFAAMPALVNSAAIKKLNYIYQFELESGTWHVIIRHGECLVRRGSHGSPTVTLKTDDKTWLGICNRETTGLKAVFSRKLSVEGNIVTADKLEKIFNFG